MASLNIDASLIEMSGLIQTKEEIVHMQNGCICCTLRGDLIREITKISEQQCFDYIVIESTGISNPMEVAESFLLDIETLNLPEKDDTTARPLSTVATMDTCITVVDAFELLQNLSSIELLGTKFAEENPPDSEKPISQLLIDQIEFSNVIVLNKIDLLTSSNLSECKNILIALNPGAKIIEACNSNVDIHEVLNTSSFSIESMQSSPMWIRSLSKQHTSETEEYGISSFIYKARKPFSPLKFHEWISKYFIAREDISEDLTEGRKLQDLANERKATRLAEFGNIFRSKGFVWLPSRNNDMIEIELSGSIVSLRPLHTWYDNIEESEWNLSEEETKLVKGNFEGIYGDRRQEIVFIGNKLNESAIIDSLNKCLISDELFSNHKANLWSKEIDPFPQWEIEIYAGFWASIISETRSELISIPDGHVLNIKGITLEQSTEEIKVVRLWMDYDGAKASALLGVLRTGKENVTMNTEIPGPATVKLRVEELSKTSSSTCFVHLIGMCTIDQVPEGGEKTGDESTIDSLGHHDHDHDHSHCNEH